MTNLISKPILPSKRSLPLTTVFSSPISLYKSFFLEQVILSTLLYKYNKKFKRQRRSILITNKAIYNIHEKGLLNTLMSVFNKSFKVKRRITINSIEAISISNISCEFALHVPGEYDYRYASTDKRDLILTTICRIYDANKTSKNLQFFFRVLNFHVNPL